MSSGKEFITRLNKKLWYWESYSKTRRKSGKLTKEEWKALTVVLYADEYPRTMYKDYDSYLFCVYDHINYPGVPPEEILSLHPCHFFDIIEHDYYNAKSFLMCYNLVDNDRNKEILRVYDLPLPHSMYDYVSYHYLKKALEEK